MVDEDPADITKEATMRRILSVAMTMLIGSVTGAHALEAGNKAPLFSAESTGGTISLTDYLGRTHVVLALYYADFTPV